MTYVITKEVFKEQWNDPDGGGITWDDIADCAVAWGIHHNPKTQPMTKILNLVLEAAGCESVEDRKPQPPFLPENR